MEEKYIACMILHAVGDTVGYKNAEWEFKKGGEERSLEKLYEFIELGGVNHISLKGWNVSDDTILSIKTAEALLGNFNSLNTYGESLKEKYLEALEMFNKEGIHKRSPGQATMKSLDKMLKGQAWNAEEYNEYSGGSGASMRTASIGLAYSGESNRMMLIQMAIESSRITHNNVIGYLGGLATALFVAFAVENININKWPFLLMDLLEPTGSIVRYINKSQRGVNLYFKDVHIFINKWKSYIDGKFDADGKPIKKRTDKNVIARGRYYLSTFGYKYQSRTLTNNSQARLVMDTTDSYKSAFIGSAGDDSVIIAYDCLLDAGNNWEKLVIYSMLHMGDTDTTGCIAGAMYGALYGMKDVPENFIKDLEFKDDIMKLGKGLYKKYKKV